MFKIGQKVKASWKSAYKISSFIGVITYIYAEHRPIRYTITTDSGVDLVFNQDEVQSRSSR